MVLGGGKGMTSIPMKKVVTVGDNKQFVFGDITNFIHGHKGGNRVGLQPRESKKGGT